MDYEELIRRIGHAQTGSGRVVLSPEDMWALQKVKDETGRPVVARTPPDLNYVGTVLAAPVRLLGDGDFQIEVGPAEPKIRGWNAAP